MKWEMAVASVWILAGGSGEVSGHRFPWANGKPAARGAREDFEKRISAMSVTTYGNAFKSSPGIRERIGITCETLASVLANPKKSVAPSMPIGFH